MRLVSKQRLDRLEQRDLLIDGVAASLRGVEEEEDARLQMSQCSDCLHLNCVPFLQGMVQNSWSVDDLEPHELVISVTHVQALSGERVGLHLDISTRDVVDKTTLAHIWKSCNQNRPFEGVDCWQSGKVFPHLLQVIQGLRKLLQTGAHSSECCSLEHFATVQTVSVLQQSVVILANIVDHIPTRTHVTKSQLVVILVVKHVDQVAVKWVDVIQLWKLLNDLSQFFIDSFLGKLHLSHIKSSYSPDLVAGVHNSRSFSHCFRKHDIHHVLSWQNDVDSFEIVIHDLIFNQLIIFFNKIITNIF